MIMTADHSHKLKLAGYPTRGNPILDFMTGNDKTGEAENSPSLAVPIRTLIMLTGLVTTISPALQAIRMRDLKILASQRSKPRLETSQRPNTITKKPASP